MRRASEDMIPNDDSRRLKRQSNSTTTFDDPAQPSASETNDPPGDIETGESTLVMLPTYNEIDNLEIIVRSLLTLAPALHLLIIDDSSPDGTGDLAERLRSEHPAKITVVHRPGKLGLGTAYVLGFRYALENGYSRIVEMDADLSHLPEQLPSILLASQGHGMALGSRYVKGGSTVKWGIHRKILSYTANLFVRKALGIPVMDATSGFRCYNRRVLEAIDLDTIHSKSYAFQIEMVWMCLRAGFDIKEVPISFVERARGVSKISQNTVLEGLGTVFRLRGTMRNEKRTDRAALISRELGRPTPSGEFQLAEGGGSQSAESLRDVRRSP